MPILTGRRIALGVARANRDSDGMSEPFTEAEIEAGRRLFDGIVERHHWMT